MAKKQVMVYLDEELYAEVKAKGLYISRLINEIMPEFVYSNYGENINKVKLKRDLNMKEEDMQQLQKEITKLKAQIKAIEHKEELEFNSNLSNVLQENEHTFFSTALEPLTRNPAFIDGQRKRYSLEFQRKITEEQFFKKLEQYKEVKNGGD